ncbi:hypothetical protein [Streptomyces pinistramenti]|uniref:hypothetical protein n=1 Tax=Streptomyces pinistramenti TaxID=2884812 RepID=UPI001D08377B|nr:hypothetical protein [Streptomyces pinistramenti]MCB5911628.1 hypothetical protein [Streptomyces pinistramenti]
MSAHQPSPTPDGRGGTPLAATRRDEPDAREQPPTMHQLLAACAAASAVSTPPESPDEARAAKAARDVKGESGATTAASTGRRDAA